jgi:SAM-dependent methyltransferase
VSPPPGTCTDEAWERRRREDCDRLASDYAREREAQYSFQAQKRIVLDMLRGVRGRVLDAGCGPAVMEPALLELGLEVRGIDVSPEMLRLGRARIAHHPLHERCRLELGEIERLGCPDAHFDAIVAMGVLEYVPDHGAVLRELHRALKPGGTLVLTVPNRVSAYRLARVACYGALGRLKRARAELAGGPGGNRCLPWRLDAELERAGLRKRESRFCNFIVFPLHDRAPALSDRLNRALSWLSATPLGISGNQYVVKAVKPA